jgi:hypothetical protein
MEDVQIGLFCINLIQGSIAEDEHGKDFTIRPTSRPLARGIRIKR